MADHPLIIRRDAAQATLDAFADRPFAWGAYDCGRMLVAHLRAMGHTVKLQKVGRYQTALGAKRAIANAGFASLADALDARFPRIAPAAAIVGDVIAMPSEGPLDAIAIAVGNGRALAYHESAAGAVVVQPLTMLAAWRIDP